VILAKALARDKAARYGSARALARDLTEFLYKQGRPVSAFEVSDLVRGAMKLRATAAPDKGSLIDRLIEEALFEFRSLDDDDDGSGDRSSGSGKRLTMAEQPIKISGLDDIGNWADELGGGGGGLGKTTSDDVMRMTLPQVALGSLGNLAALEDEEPRASPVPASPRGVPAPRISAPGGAPVVSSPTPPLATPAAGAAIAPAPNKWAAGLPPPEPKSGGGALKVVIAVAVLAIAGAGAWFGGLIPH
jgi:serine/threonine-protein kinase